MDALLVADGIIERGMSLTFKNPVSLPGRQT